MDRGSPAFLDPGASVPRDGADCRGRWRGEVSLLTSKYSAAAQGIRRAFFAEARDISNWQVHRDVTEVVELDFTAVSEQISSGEAVARPDADYNLALRLGVTGSPTLAMNEDRQRLFGNVGYHLIEANVLELLREPAHDQASWC